MPTRRDFLALAAASSSLHAAARPNVLWISCEDTGPQLSCYGDPHSRTPNLDRLAGEGIRYQHAYSVAGVCAPSRSGIITGMYPAALGSQHMRCQVTLPEGVLPFPAYLRQAGYYCTNNAKTDYNFIHPKETWDESSQRAHWRNRTAGQPFFSVFNIETTHESRVRMRGEEYASQIPRLQPGQRQDPARLTTLPPYYPDTPETRRDWANYYELISDMDAQFGARLREIEDAGLLSNTIVFFWGDHGVGLPRAKRWLYESGTHVPLLVRIPGEKPRVERRLVSLIDLGPTVLSLCGVPVPDHMHGQAFLGAGARPERQYVYGHRDRMDETYDLIRAVRDPRYRYIRNYRPELPYAQIINTPEDGNVMKEMRRVRAAGGLNAAQQKFFAPRKPAEELYDVQNDPHELNNLAAQPALAPVLRRMRAEHERWTESILDAGFLPEPMLDDEGRRRGSRYQVFRGPGGLEWQRRLRRLASGAGNLRAALQDTDPSARWWALRRLDSGLEDSDLEIALGDPHGVVRVEAARQKGLRAGPAEKAVDVLIRALTDRNEWTRLAAAHALEELGPRAAPARAALATAAEPPARGDRGATYLWRVASRALKKLG
jgi:uncharacterized sulfatase